MRSNVKEGDRECVDYECVYNGGEMGLSGEKEEIEGEEKVLMELIEKENQRSIEGTKKVLTLNMSRKA